METPFLDTGTVHAIGAGLVIEIQQTSDITYRLYALIEKDAWSNTRTPC
jgi:mannose-6-phosphate isomerase class I